MVADVCSFSSELQPLLRGGQFMWRIASVHLNNDHAKKQQAGRQTLCDYFCLMLRDHVDVITGDWNQAHNYIGEAFSHAAKLHERKTGENPQWILTPPDGEIRTIILNWPFSSQPSLTGPQQYQKLLIKPVNKWGAFDAADFGLRASDSDSHSPHLYLLRKADSSGHAAVHGRSEAGKKRDAERRKQKRREKRAAQ